MNETIRSAALVQRNFRKNRVIVSRDIEPMLLDIAREAGAKLTLHRFPSGADIGTWVVPPRWDVRKACLTGPDGTVVASYDDHPLFAVPYSKPFRGKISLETLKQHVRCHPTQMDAFYYEHRFAYNYPLRLSDWAITLPRNLLDRLVPGDYTVELDFDIGDGDMLVGELFLPGESEDTIALLTDFCHPGQVNDSFSGILAMLDVFARLRDKPRKYSYRFLIFPETIGSAVLLHSIPSYVKTTKLAIFSEFVGWGRNWKVLGRQSPQSLTGKLGHEAQSHWDGLRFDDLFNGYGNDELIFDFVGIPSLSVQMSDCDEYHSSRDAPELLVQANLDRAADIIYRLCDVMERDGLFVLNQAVPFYMTRFNLYADSIGEHGDFVKNRAIILALRQPTSLLDISAAEGISFDDVADYVGRLLEHGLVRRVAPGDR